MADRYPELQPRHIEFIRKQHLFFVATAPANGTVNVSPKGMDTLRVINTNKLVWLNLTGSGNETSAHVRENGRMTLMFCSFDKQPLILRLYGAARVIHPRDRVWNALIRLFDDHVGARQLFEMDIRMAQTSCGFAVPYYDYLGERETLTNWSEKRGRQGIKAYWKQKNQLSLDGGQTGILVDAEPDALE